MLNKNSSNRMIIKSVRRKTEFRFQNYLYQINGSITCLALLIFPPFSIPWLALFVVTFFFIFRLFGLYNEPSQIHGLENRLIFISHRKKQTEYLLNDIYYVKNNDGFILYSGKKRIFHIASKEWPGYFDELSKYIINGIKKRMDKKI